ncbi:MAG: GNAT family protein [Methanomassiliicoccales archaeon]|nr:GNAT family protein [Methanomassiliicoccales archaeon]
MLRGRLVGLEPLQSTDEITMFRWLNDPKARRAAGRPSWKACYSLEQVQDIIKERLAQPSRFDLVVLGLSQETPLGLVEIGHLQPMSDSAQVTLIWGEKTDQEQMEEALALATKHLFDGQGLHRLWTRVSFDNQPVLDAFQAVGFQVEGVLRQDHFNGGEWRDSTLLSLLSTEAKPC